MARVGFKALGMGSFDLPEKPQVFGEEKEAVVNAAGTIIGLNWLQIETQITNETMLNFLFLYQSVVYIDQFIDYGNVLPTTFHMLQ